MPTVKEVLANAGLDHTSGVVKSALRNTPLTLNATDKKDDASSPGPSSTEKAQVNKAALGRGVAGQNIYPVDEDTHPLLHYWNRIIWNAAKEEGLDPFPVVYWMCRRDTLLSAAARGGFPVNLPHWKNGMEFRELSTGHQYALQRIYEMILNTNPSHAYLLEGNEIFDQKLVMCHCMGHSDFFKNNIWFSNTKRNMMDRIAEHADYVRNLQRTKRVSPLEIEKFLDRAFSVEGLIDIDNLNPEPIEYEVYQTKEAEPLPEDYGVIDTSKMPRHIARRLNDPAYIQKIQQEERERREQELRMIPKHPDRDVLGFIIKHSKVLKPWQRTLLGFIREQGYYFAPQAQTKIMNEGWAVFWHQRLMNRDDIKDYSHIVQVADHNSGTLAMNPTRFNPYTVGVAIFKDIKERWDKGQHGEKWNKCDDRAEKREWDTGEMKGMEKIFDVRKRYKDTEFIDEFLTPEVARDLGLYKFSHNEHSGYYEIETREFKSVKNQIVAAISNGGRPIIEVLDGNFRDNGELLLNHVWAYNLDLPDAHETLKNLLFMWGKPVHLNTKDVVIDEHYDYEEYEWVIEKVEEAYRITVEFVLLVNNDGEKPGIRTRYFKLHDHGAETEPFEEHTEEIDEEDLKFLGFQIKQDL